MGKKFPEHRKGGGRMTLSISLTLLLGLAVFVLCKYAGLKFWQAAVSILFGFFLASSSFAPYISQFVTSLIRAF
jgi:hypothetical protein